MYKIYPVVFCLVLAACTTGYNPRYRYNEVQVVNLSTETITDVRLEIVDSPKNLACDEVLMHAMCADRFNRHWYPQQGFRLSWKQPDQGHQQDLVSPAIPLTYNSVFPLRIVMEIKPNGSVKVFYEQDEPDRNRVRVIGG